MARRFETQRQWINDNFNSRASFIENELELTTKGLAGAMSSVINDWGFNRRMGADGSHFNAHFGRRWSRNGGFRQNNYVAPVVQQGSETVWRRGLSKKELYTAWDDYIMNSQGFGTGTRRVAYRALGGKGSSVNKFLAIGGGFSTILPPAVSLYFASQDAMEGYKKDGIVGGLIGAAKGYVSMAIVNRIIGSALMNPLRATVAGGLLIGAGYAGNRVLGVLNDGNDYLKMGKMNLVSWKRGPGSAMISSNAQMQKQRSIAAVENSRYSSMRGLGNEAYMATAPRGRYGNNTILSNTHSMISY